MSDTVQIISAIGTFLAVFVALFGEPLRKKLFPPRLRLILDEPAGLAVPIDVRAPDGCVRRTTARYYHVRVVNDRRWSPATACRVFISQIAENDASGRPVPKLTSAIALRWREWDTLGPEPRTVGAGAEVDLCSVVRGRGDNEAKWVEFHPVVMPMAFEWRRRSAFQLFVTLQASAVEADSPPLQLQVSWDGRWADGSNEMQHHLVVGRVDGGSRSDRNYLTAAPLHSKRTTD